MPIHIPVDLQTEGCDVVLQFQAGEQIVIQLRPSMKSELREGRMDIRLPVEVYRRWDIMLLPDHKS